MPAKRKPKRGRPSLGTAAQSVVVTFRLTAAQAEAIEQRIASEYQDDNLLRPSVSSWVRRLISDAIRD